MKKYRDHYFLKAKQENYPARSVYKLQEIDKRFTLLKSGQNVLDLGAAPGSWTIWAAHKVGGAGRVLGVDLQDTRQAFPANARFLRQDVFSDDPAFLEAIAALALFDVVLSDMAPSTTGIKFTDQARSLELCERVRELALRWLAPGGSFVAKIFEGPDVKAYTDSLRPLFETVKAFKPKSSRSESKEIFVVALGFRDYPE